MQCGLSALAMRIDTTKITIKKHSTTDFTSYYTAHIQHSFSNRFSTL